MTVKSAKPMTTNGAKPAAKSIRTTTIKPLGDGVLLEALEAQEKLKSGIIIPDTAKERPSEGLVIAVGSGRVRDDGKRIAVEVKKGDRVLYGKYAGAEIKIEEKPYLILRETDILAIL